MPTEVRMTKRRLEQRSHGDTVAPTAVSEGLTNQHGQVHLHLAPSCSHQHPRRLRPDGERPPGLKRGLGLHSENAKHNRVSGKRCGGRRGEVFHVLPG